MKIRGPQLKYFAAVMAVIAIVAGIWMTFFQSRGFVKTTATTTRRSLSTERTSGST
ncbi:MAG: hypothetical protein IKG66_07340 [Lachnospiraceae bacterium]|nr:hypothetical protein [Lachnospiraceae bacterium]